MIKKYYSFLNLSQIKSSPISGEHFAIRAQHYGPLALIQEGSNPPKLKLAIPHKVGDHKSIAGYSYDDSGEHGVVQKFKTACPADTKNQVTIEMQWKRTMNASKDSRLFFLQEYTDVNMKCRTYFNRPGPSIQETNRECGKSQGEIYEVGYPVNRVNFLYFCILKLQLTKVPPKF